ncbi:hypothetical protein D9758_009459 [Tetrapyrgos nigripes]|uniref:Uncharacterized protein n=1 Tax=Tetrapyrgos nigripes TaxID=182062 RepID=A0A8H5D1N0_9AGAR|nr:hypothetical protein D9758_009459 [Tetrapyrgos nigripes]
MDAASDRLPTTLEELEALVEARAQRMLQQETNLQSAKLQTAYDYAEEFANHESHYYPLLVLLAMSPTIFIRTHVLGYNFITGPQHLLIPNGWKDISTRNYLNIFPDEALLLRLALLRLVCLFEAKVIWLPGFVLGSWDNLTARSRCILEHKVLLENREIMGQVLVQGAMALKAYHEPYIPHFFVGANTFTLFRFDSFPDSSNLVFPVSYAADAQAKEQQIAELLPEDHAPKILMFAKPVFSRGPANRLRFSSDMCKAISWMYSRFSNDLSFLPSTLFEIPIDLTVQLPEDTENTDTYVKNWYSELPPSTTDHDHAQGPQSPAVNDSEVDNASPYPPKPKKRKQSVRNPVVEVEGYPGPVAGPSNDGSPPSTPRRVGRRPEAGNARKERPTGLKRKKAD